MPVSIFNQTETLESLHNVTFRSKFLLSAILEKWPKPLAQYLVYKCIYLERRGLQMGLGTVYVNNFQWNNDFRLEEVYRYKKT